jgi:hypothetical protein
VEGAGLSLTQPNTGIARSASPDLDQTPRVPYPISPEQQRIFRENNLIARLNAAMDSGDFLELRRRNSEYRKEYPDDAHLLQDAYDMIADAQERSTRGDLE